VKSGLSVLAQAAAAESVAPAFRSMRANGAAEFARLGLPASKNEDWLYTSVSAIAAGEFTRTIGDVAVDASSLTPFLFANPEWPLVVFVNGQWSAALSSLSNLPDGVRVQSLVDAVSEQPELLEKYIGHIVPASRDGFTALNVSAVGVGVVMQVAKEMVSDVPLHILHVVTPDANGLLVQPRHLLLVERHAKASVIESFVSLGEPASFTNTVTEVVVEDGATLHHLRIQRESQHAYHVGTVEARQGRDSHFVSFSFIAGSALSRTNVYTVLAGEGCGTTLNGLYLLDGTQHGDTQTRVEHVAPNCFSREMYKGLLDGASHGVFNGKVYVHPKHKRPTASKRIKRCCCRTRRRSTPNRNSRFSPTTSSARMVLPWAAWMKWRSFISKVAALALRSRVNS